MKIFLLDDSAAVVNGIKVDMESKHDIHAAFTLNDAAGCLEVKPGVKNFDLFLFDVAVPGYTVKGKKGEVVYNDETFGYNGLHFLLNNLDILKGQIRYTAIITAFKNQIITMKNINVFGKHYSIYSRKLQQNNELEKIVVRSGFKSYTFTVLDKGRNAIATDINRFIDECYPKIETPITK